MATFVTKKDGSRVPFDVAKIKHGIMSAAMEAELSEQEAEGVANEVSEAVRIAFDGIEEVPTSDIREKIVSELESTSPAVAESWKRYEEGKNE